MRMVTEIEFRKDLLLKLYLTKGLVDKCRSVIGPGRSGAVAAVYVSHMTSLPFYRGPLPVPDHLQPVLIVDTATMSGATLRKTAQKAGGPNLTLAVYAEPPKVKFWYEEWNLNGRLLCRMDLHRSSGLQPLDWRTLASPAPPESQSIGLKEKTNLSEPPLATSFELRLDD